MTITSQRAHLPNTTITGGKGFHCMNLGGAHKPFSGEEPGWLLPGVGSCLQLRWQTRPQQAPVCAAAHHSLLW